MLAQKISNLRNYVLNQTATGLLLASLGHETNDAVLTYLLGYEPEYAAVLITQNHAVLWLTPFEVPEAKLKFPELVVRALTAQLTTLFQEVLPAGTLLIRGTVLSTNLAKRLTEVGYTLVDAHQVEHSLALKNPAEIAAMRAVCIKTDELFAELIAHWSEFKTEQDAAIYIPFCFGK